MDDSVFCKMGQGSGRGCPGECRHAAHSVVLCGRLCLQSLFDWGGWGVRWCKGKVKKK